MIGKKNSSEYIKRNVIKVQYIFMIFMKDFFWGFKYVCVYFKHIIFFLQINFNPKLYLLYNLSCLVAYLNSECPNECINSLLFACIFSHLSNFLAAVSFPRFQTKLKTKTFEPESMLSTLLRTYFTKILEQISCFFAVF